MRISDNGVGLPEYIDTNGKKNHGTQLIPMLSKQLGANLEIHNSIGTEYVIRFNSNPYKKRM